MTICQLSKYKCGICKGLQCHRSMSLQAVQAGKFPAKCSCVGVAVPPGCCKFTCILYIVMKLTHSVFEVRNGREAYLKWEVPLQLPLAANYHDLSSSIWCCWAGSEAVLLSLWPQFGLLVNVLPLFWCTRSRRYKKVWASQNGFGKRHRQRIEVCLPVSLRLFYAIIQCNHTK